MFKLITRFLMFGYIIKHVGGQYSPVHTECVQKLYYVMCSLMLTYHYVQDFVCTHKMSDDYYSNFLKAINKVAFSDSPLQMSIRDLYFHWLTRKPPLVVLYQNWSL